MPRCCLCCLKPEMKTNWPLNGKDHNDFKQTHAQVKTTSKNYPCRTGEDLRTGIQFSFMADASGESVTILIPSYFVSVAQAVLDMKG